ncbi:MAG: peptide chain release factor N(5)-glutamine methyltransferase [Candidatus Krumholzibacteria bacterium]|nr:peptide chain release factor N(5)-glutamine methyltransferase [Candidatus Krumholzibacteria bacterium]
MHFGPCNVSQLIRQGESHLITNGVPNARCNAEWLLAHVLGCRSADLYLDTRRVLDRTQVEAYRSLIKRRGMREPLQYIIGATEFMSLPFYSSPGVFIPRPDTEVLVEKIESLVTGLNPDGEAMVLDLCCGSGVIAICLLKRVATAMAIGVDASPAAICLTLRNAELNGVQDRLDGVVSTARDFLGDNRTRFDIVVCNPPYVPLGDIDRLPPEVRLHEPKQSLDGGSDGLDFYRDAVPRLVGSLKRGGIVAFEIGVTQGEIVCDLLSKSSFVDIEVCEDYAGLDRVVVARSV